MYSISISMKSRKGVCCYQFNSLGICVGNLKVFHFGYFVLVSVPVGSCNVQFVCILCCC